MPTSQNTKNLSTMYLSTLGILCCLLIVAQLVIQFALMQALITQNAYAVLNAQQLRTQRLIRNSILLLDTKGDRPGLLLSLYSDDQQWELTQDGIEHGNAGLHISPSDFPTAVHTQLKNASADYLKMQAALRDLLKLEVGGNPPAKSVVVDIAPIFYSGGVYSAALTRASEDLLTESTVYIVNIRFIELALFLLCIFTLIGEYTLVFRPVFAHMKSYLAQLHELIAEQEQVIHQERRTPSAPFIDESAFQSAEEAEREAEEETGVIDERQKGFLEGEEHHPHTKGN